METKGEHKKGKMTMKVIKCKKNKNKSCFQTKENQRKYNGNVYFQNSEVWVFVFQIAYFLNLFKKWY